MSCGPDEPTPIETDKTVPTISIILSEVNVFGGKAVTVSEGKLSIGGKDIATWSDDKTAAADLKADITFNDIAIQSGAVLSEAGIIKITVTDEAGNESATFAIDIISQAIFGLESLGDLLQADQEANLLG